MAGPTWLSDGFGSLMPVVAVLSLIRLLVSRRRGVSISTST